ncbi:hypothetical protein JG687_00012597, partial [Phytophthora cactorum]
ALSKSVIEDKADAKLILLNRKGSEGKPDVRALAKKHGCSRTTIRNVLNAATSRHLGPRSSQATGDTFHVVQRHESEDRSDNQPSSGFYHRIFRDRRCGRHRRGSALGGCSCRDHRRRDSDGCRDMPKPCRQSCPFSTRTRRRDKTFLTN